MNINGGSRISQTGGFQTYWPNRMGGGVRWPTLPESRIKMKKIDRGATSLRLSLTLLSHGLFTLTDPTPITLPILIPIKCRNCHIAQILTPIPIPIICGNHCLCVLNKDPILSCAFVIVFLKDVTSLIDN